MIKTAVIEDNKRLQKEIVAMVENVPGFRVEGTAGSVANAVDLIISKQPDLLLLDVALQDGSAFEILEKTIHLNYQIIFLTAHHEYALKAIKFGALDYLIKPLDEIEFYVALRKITKEHNQKEQIKIALEAFSEKSKNNRLVLHSSNRFQIVTLDQIIYCQSDNGYTTFHLVGDKKILTSKYLKEYEDVLSNTDFLRVHQSYLVNKKFIEVYMDGNLILNDNSQIPVSHRKRELIMEFLKGKV
jgi:two-component system LytT family response regulator